METEFRRVLEAAFPGEEARHYLPMSIGKAPVDADAGAALILDGTKTATSSPFWDSPDDRIPFVGALSVLPGEQRCPRRIVETTRIEIMPFGSVDADFARSYGEGERTLAWWRREMGGYYKASAACYGTEFPESTEIVCEWITVVRRL